MTSFPVAAIEEPNESFEASHVEKKTLTPLRREVRTTCVKAAVVAG